MRPVAFWYLWVRIPPGVWMSVSCECCLLSGRCLCVGLITRPEKSYRVWLSECDREASTLRRPWSTRGWCAMERRRRMGYDMIFEVLTAAPINDYAFWDTMLCRLTNKIWQPSFIITKYERWMYDKVSWTQRNTFSIHLPIQNSRFWRLWNFNCVPFL
jgi:hypothetical protein